MPEAMLEDSVVGTSVSPLLPHHLLLFAVAFETCSLGFYVA
jgi:hypothetical protein